MLSDIDDIDSFLANFGKNKNVIPITQSTDDPDPEPIFQGLKLKRTPKSEPAPHPVPYEKIPLTKLLCTFDTETDPFKYGRSPLPFWTGFYDGNDFVDFWGDDCIQQFFDYLEERKRNDPTFNPVIYAHNGGKFDFMLMLPFLDPGEKPFMINGRIVKCSMRGFEFRDSLAIIPVAQAKFAGAKLKIDYDLFERDAREQHKELIREYARHDVVSLYNIVCDYIDRFGWRITVASTALPLLESFHGFNRMSPEQDQAIRPYYKGGRVQCFKKGLHLGPLIMVDRNSMYPSAMREYQHPVGVLFRKYKDIRDDTDFAYISCDNNGALGVGNGLDYDFAVRRGKFLATIHEIRAGLDTDTISNVRVHSSYSFVHKSNFAAFVDTYYGLRQQAALNGDKTGKELYKLMLNSSYGKLCQNTEHYKDWLINPKSMPQPQYAAKHIFEEYTDETGRKKFRCTHSPDGWNLFSSSNHGDIWSKPAYGHGQKFINVAAGASITGAARSELWRAICMSDNVLYCDTDSIICSSTSIEIDETKLGAWKIEARGDACVIAGKKMYAFLSLSDPGYPCDIVNIDGSVFFCLKKAHKGVQLTGQDIADICNGKVIEHEHMAPSYDLAGRVKWTKRRVKMTGTETSQMELPL